MCLSKNQPQLFGGGPKELRIGYTSAAKPSWGDLCATTEHIAKLDV
jgi:hypothetical protein